MDRLNQARVPAEELLEFIKGIVEFGYGQVGLSFDWRTGEWNVAWPNWAYKPEEEEEEDDP